MFSSDPSNCNSDAPRCLPPPPQVFYYQLMEVSDFRNDVILAEACRADVEAYCGSVEPGEGRVHACLRFNRDQISDRCRCAAGFDCVRVGFLCPCYGCLRFN